MCLVPVKYPQENLQKKRSKAMRMRVLSLKVSEDELDVIQENYKSFLLEKQKPWSRHRWMKSLLLDRPPMMLEGIELEIL